MDKLIVPDEELFAVNFLEDGDKLEYYTIPEIELNFLVTGFYNLLYDNADAAEPDEFITGMREVLGEYEVQAKYLIAQAIVHAVSNFERIVKNKHVAEYKDGKLVEEI